MNLIIPIHGQALKSSKLKAALLPGSQELGGCGLWRGVHRDIVEDQIQHVFGKDVNGEVSITRKNIHVAWTPGRLHQDCMYKVQGVCGSGGY